MVEIWVPILGSGASQEDALRPDLPGQDKSTAEIMALAAEQARADGRGGDDKYVTECARRQIVQYTTDEGLTTDLVTGGHAVSLFNVLVDEADLPRIEEHLKAKGKSAIPFDKGSEADVFLLRMIRACREGYDARADEFFTAAVPASATEAQREIAKVALVQAAARGLAPDRADTIRTKHTLPSASQKDGIDAEVHAAAVQYVVRQHGVSIDTARAAVKLRIERSLTI